MAYPIFAFLLVEGYFHTSSLPLYLLRVFAGAVFAEVPFNLMYGGSFIRFRKPFFSSSTPSWPSAWGLALAFFLSSACSA